MMHQANETAEHSKRPIYFVWVALLAITGIETFLAYQRLELKVMFVALMALSIVKASLIIAYFMHLRYERRSLTLTLMPALVWVLVMLMLIFPDAVRLFELRPK